ncbi:MAG: hypothetical protein K1X89_23715 [Myxococcaceae bacterium]|nr:hypothetical protein [Myxococcaceae bacterium]
MRTLSVLLAWSVLGCASVRPAGSGQLPLSVTGDDSSWRGALGEQQLSKAETFLAAGFDATAEKIDARKRYAWGGLAAGVGLGAAATACGYGFGQNIKNSSGPAGYMVCAIFAGSWALTGFIVSLTHFLADDPPADVGRAAAQSYYARLELERLGVHPTPPDPTDEPTLRAPHDAWLLDFTRASGIARVELGLSGLSARHPDAVGFPKDRVLQSIAEAYATAPPETETLLAWARFTLEHADAVGSGPVEAALVRGAPGDVSGELWIALGDVRRTRGDAEGALDAYRSAWERAPLLPNPIRAYGDELVRHGKVSAAIDFWASQLPRAERDTARFMLLESIDRADHAWLYAHADTLPKGLLPAFRAYQAQQRQRQRLSQCLGQCYGSSYASVRNFCTAQCYALAGD